MMDKNAAAFDKTPVLTVGRHLSPWTLVLPIHSSLHVTLALYKLFLLTYLLTYLLTVNNWASLKAFNIGLLYKFTLPTSF